MNKNRNHINEGNRAYTILMYVLAVLVILVTVYPMYYVIIMSISDPIDVAAKRVFLYPTALETSAYTYVIKDGALWTSLRNSVFYVIITTAIHLFICITFAYPMVMPNLPLKKIWVWFLLIPMYFSGGLIPTFLIMTKVLNLYNTIWAVILPASISVWHIILMRTYFFSAVPTSLREAAMIDGANHYQTLLKIYVPLSKPIMAVIAIYTIVGVWNSWFNASVYLPNSALHPVQLYLKQMLVDSSNTTGEVAAGLSSEDAEELMRMQMVKMQLQYSAIVITTLPVLLVYPFLQKYFVKGVMVGSLKG